MARLEAEGRTIDSLSDAELGALGLGVDARDLLQPRTAVSRRASLGGTSWAEVERQISLLRERLK